tara:strand:+ start:744 stop:1289 length:546 start_codon:yes stop_codon:yes gene_type:complete
MKIQSTNIDKDIHLVSIPDLLWHDILNLKYKCDQIRQNPLSFLKLHENAGSNAFQVSLPSSDFEKSYLMPFILRYCSDLIGCSHREICFRKNEGHFDTYDIWINYAGKNSVNPVHSHFGNISGVIYIENRFKEPIFFPKRNIVYEGEPKTMILFPSTESHEVKEKKTDGERITMAFNLLKL